MRSGMEMRPGSPSTVNLRNLEIFVAVSRLGSISRAGTSLGLAQSVVSRCIAQLESDWGERLFDRTGRGVRHSDFGRRMLPQIEALLAQCATLHEEARASAAAPTGLVRVGVVPSLMDTLMPAPYAAVGAAAPGLRLQFVEAMQGPLETQLASGRVDLAVINRYGSQVRCAMDEEALGESKTYLVMRSDNPLAARDAIPLRELRDLPLVVPIAPSGLRSLLDDLARKAGIVLNVALEVESLVAMIRFVHTADAMTILPFAGVEGDVLAGILSAVEITEPAIPRRITLTVSRAQPATKATRLVAACLRNVVPPVLVDRP